MLVKRCNGGRESRAEVEVFGGGGAELRNRMIGGRKKGEDPRGRAGSQSREAQNGDKDEYGIHRVMG